MGGEVIPFPQDPLPGRIILRSQSGDKIYIDVPYTLATESEVVTWAEAVLKGYLTSLENGKSSTISELWTWYFENEDGDE